MQGAVYSFRSALYTGLFDNGVRRAEKGAECEVQGLKGKIMQDFYVGA